MSELKELGQSIEPKVRVKSEFKGNFDNSLTDSMRLKANSEPSLIFDSRLGELFDHLNRLKLKTSVVDDIYDIVRKNLR